MSLSATVFLCVSLALLTGVRAKPYTELDDSAVDFALMKALLERPQAVSRLGSWSWNDCSDGKDAIFANVVIGPDPVVIPGYINIDANVTLKQDIKSPLEVVLVVKKKVGPVWFPLPCVENIGSCTYEDVCSMIPFKPTDPCPDPLPELKIPCTCPFKLGTFSLPKTWFNIPKLPKLPISLADGQYKVNAKLSVSGVEVGCYDVTMSLKVDE